MRSKFRKSRSVFTQSLDVALPAAAAAAAAPAAALPFFEGKNSAETKRKCGSSGQRLLHPQPEQPKKVKKNSVAGEDARGGGVSWAGGGKEHRAQ